MSSVDSKVPFVALVALSAWRGAAQTGVEPDRAGIRLKQLWRGVSRLAVARPRKRVLGCR